MFNGGPLGGVVTCQDDSVACSFTSGTYLVGWLGWMEECTSSSGTICFNRELSSSSCSSNYGPDAIVIR